MLLAELFLQEKQVKKEPQRGCGAVLPELLVWEAIRKVILP